MDFPRPKPGEIRFILVGLSVLLIALGVVGLYVRFTAAPEDEIATRLTQYSVASVVLGTAIGVILWIVRKLMD
jgi:uncharacterized membrane protein YqjE